MATRPFLLWSGRHEWVFIHGMSFSNSSQHLLKTFEQLSQDGFISSIEASEQFSITNDYVTRLCRQKKIKGVFLSRLWFVQKKSLEDYLLETKQRREEQRRMLSKQLREEYREKFLIAHTI